ncbi:unnamed protein product [Ambrosiozyma monospora]|uniref:Unnamed protein product n=1 Tax=Ambrosiozyma monospora TaxID=43982 RepID=A0A9W7DCQ0_AMBMO|nr:unnamed protein product [Ambrosiozyma monospora]
MKVLIVFAHPEPHGQSLNHSLFKVTIDELQKLGHEVKTSDLYAMNWKANVDADDFTAFDKVNDRLKINAEREKSYKNGTLSKDVLEEQEKLMWADFLILQFPLWWFSMPAIMKGWADRVLTNGFINVVSVKKNSPAGLFKGKRAMLLVTVGGPERSFSETGVSGDTFDLLFPIQHGILFYAGYQVMQPYLVWLANWLPEESFEKIADELRERLKNLETDEPIPFRAHNSGDYDEKTLSLKPEVLNPNVKGLRVHLRK